MSFDFGSNNIPPLKAQSAYKDGGGMGGGGMYMKQGKNNRKDQPEEDIFEFKKDKDDSEISFDSNFDEKDIPQDTFFNKFVNWFRKENH